MNPGFLCDSPVRNPFSDNDCLCHSLIGSNDGPGATLVMMCQDKHNQSSISISGLSCMYVAAV